MSDLKSTLSEVTLFLPYDVPMLYKNYIQVCTIHGIINNLIIPDDNLQRHSEPR